MTDNISTDRSKTDYKRVHPSLMKKTVAEKQ
jgi:hypothetical protein